MKIGVLSDTHIPLYGTRLPDAVLLRLKECDLIIHAGDITESGVIEHLATISETKAVRGNMDAAALRKSLPEKLLLECAGKSIGVTHGKGPSREMIGTLKKTFPQKPDIIIFGHSHIPLNQTIDGTLFFNPGSPMDTSFAPYRSFGLISIENGEIKSEIIRLDGGDHKPKL